MRRNAVIVLLIVIGMLIASTASYINTERDKKIAHAELWLGVAKERSNQQDISGITEYVRKSSQENSFTLERINTSEDKLKEIEMRGYISESRKALRTAKENSTRIEELDELISRAEKYALKANTSLETEFGFSEDKLEKLRNTKTAQYWFGYAQKHSNEREVDMEIEWAKEYALKANISIDELGFSEDKLEKIQKKGYASTAEYWLNSARNSTEETSGLYKIILVRDYAARANVGLETLKTSEDELKELERKAHADLASFFLKVARKNAANQNVYPEVLWVREDAKEANLTLEKLGTTENELLELEKQGYISEAKFLVRFIKQNIGNFPVGAEIQIIRKDARKANIPLEKVGTSEEELKIFEKTNKQIIYKKTI